MKQLLPLLTFSTLFALVACTPSPHPKNPKYEIIKPRVKYTPSKASLEKMVKQLQGSPYVWAEEGPNQFDCSGFTYYMYGSMGIEIPRVAREQAKVGKRISLKELQYGDLIFFATSRRSRKKITHVGMYLGDGWFTHASTVKNEVVYSNLFTSPYYKKRLRICRRYLPEEKTPTLKPQEVWEKPSQPTYEKVATQTKTTPSKGKKAILIRSSMQNLEASATKHYYVQVGSFSNHPKASLLKTLKAHQMHYRILKFPHQKGDMLKVLVGPYASRTHAQEVLTRIRKEIQPSAFIAEIR